MQAKVMDSWSFSYKKRTLKPKLLRRLEICIKLGQNNWIIISQTIENQAKVMDCSSFSYFSLFSPARQKKKVRDRFKRSYKVTKIAEQPNLPTTEQPSNRTTQLLNYRTANNRTANTRAATPGGWEKEEWGWKKKSEGGKKRVKVEKREQGLFSWQQKLKLGNTESQTLKSR